MSDYDVQDVTHALLVGLLTHSMRVPGDRATKEIKITSIIKPTLNTNPKSLLRVNTQAVDQKSPLLTVDDLKRPGVSRVHTLPPVYEERHETTQETATVPTPPASDDESSVHESVYTDMPITVYEVLKLIITHALSISAKDIITQDVTIRQLAGDLEYDVLSDLHGEFGPLPNKAETMTLAELARSLDVNFQGKLGRRSSSIVSKVVSGMMPPSFSSTKAKKYLLDRWGLGPGPQNSILMTLVSKPPVSRFISDQVAKDSLDDLARRYAIEQNVVLKPASTSDSTCQNGTAPSSVAAITTTRRRNSEIASFEICKKLLRDRLQNGDAEALRLHVEATRLLKLMDTWKLQHVPKAFDGFEAAFDSSKIQRFNSSGNWALQDLYTLVYDVMVGRSGISRMEIDHQASLLSNRASSNLLKAVSYLRTKYAATEAANSRQSMEVVLQRLMDYFEQASKAAPAAVVAHTNLDLLQSPRSIAQHSGIQTPLSGPSMMSGGFPSAARSIPEFRLEEYTDASSQSQKHGVPRVKITSIKPIPSPIGTPSTVPWSPSVYSTDTHLYRNIPHGNRSEDTLPPPYTPRAMPRAGEINYIRKKVDGRWEIDPLYTSAYTNTLDVASSYGMSFSDKKVLVTGATPDSITEEIIRHLLSGGAKVLVTTLECSVKEKQRFQSLYSQYGSRGSEIILVPFNQGNESDADDLARYIYRDLEWSLDHIFPFGAISQHDEQIEDAGAMSDDARGQILARTLRLLNAIKREKEAAGLNHWPAQVILPLSPSTAMFSEGSDETDLGNILGVLFSKWYSEDWNAYLSLCGVVVGMTDGTEPIKGNPALAHEVKKMGGKIYTSAEMASNILGLLMPLMLGLTEREPIIADISGGLSSVSGLDEMLMYVGQGVAQRIAMEEQTPIEPNVIEDEFHTSAEIAYDFPRLPDYKQTIEPLSGLRRDMVDLDRVAVIVGFSEIGPWGNSRTRCHRELCHGLSPEACVELAWMTGLVKYSNHELVDAKTGEVIPGHAVKARYLKHLMSHSGIRLVQHEQQPQLQEIVIQEDLPPFEASQEMTSILENIEGDRVMVYEHPRSGKSLIQLKKGAVLQVPGTAKSKSITCGQIPDEWDPRVYGISEKLIEENDRASLYNLVMTCEALLAAGIVDPYELYQYAHVSEVTSLLGGTHKTANKTEGTPSEDQSQPFDGKQDQPAVSDLANSLLLNSVGMSVAGGGVTAAHAFHSGFEMITSGKAKICVIGNTTADNLSGMTDGANISCGGGVQILCSAQLALEMGLPIHGVVAHAHASTDAILLNSSGSGSGLLTAVAESPLRRPSPLLSLKYRQRQLDMRLQEIEEWSLCEMSYLRDQGQMSSENDSRDISVEAAYLKSIVQRHRKQAQYNYGNAFWKGDAHVSPMRGALATWGLTVDDINIISFSGNHNDLAQSRIINEQMTRLGRTEGNPLLAVFQRPVTGHAPGVSSAWSLNSSLQILDSGLVPGDRTIENVDAPFQELEHIMYPSKNIQTPCIDAFAATSIEDGKSFQTIGVHPKYLFATLGEEDFARYADKREQRFREAEMFFRNGIAENKLFVAKESPPWPEDEIQRVLMDPTARLLPS